MKTQFLVLFFLAAYSLAPLQGADVRLITVSKVEDYIQPDAKGPILNSPGAFSFYASVELTYDDAVASSTVMGPNQQVVKLTPGSSPLILDFLDFFDNPLLLDRAYPEGIYRVDLVGRKDGRQSATLPLPKSFFPNVPRLLNWSDAQKLRADQPFEFSWEPFVEGTAGDLIQFQIYDFEGNLVFGTPDVGGQDKALDGTAKSLQLPAKVLQPGTEYRAFLVFSRTASSDIKSYPGATALARFTRQTEFPIFTAGTPDLPNVQFQLSFSYFAYGGDFFESQTVAPIFPLTLDDCYVARLYVLNEEFLPIANDVIFSSPPQTAVQNVPAEYRYAGENGFFYETPCLDQSAVSLPGPWTVNYNQYPLTFEVPDAQPTQRLVLPVPFVTLENDILKRLDWVYYDSKGNKLGNPPSFITNQFIELYNDANFPIQLTTNQPPPATSFTFTQGPKWTEIRRLVMSYQDDLGNWYIVNFDHSPRGSLAILNSQLPLGSIATPYSVSLIASNGTPPYAWSIDGALPSGLKLDAVKGAIDGVPETVGTYRFGIRVDDQAGNFEHDQFFITVTTNGPPIILKQPGGGSVTAGDFTYFDVTAEGTQPLSYQWFFEGQPINGATSATFLLEEITTKQAGVYTVSISNQLGSTISKPARLTVLEPPLIVSQPKSQIAQAGSDITFGVEVRGAQPIFYQWRRNGEVLEGATNASYTIPKAQPEDSGTYYVLVAGPEGVVRSDDATLEFIIDNLSLNNRFASRVELKGPAGLGRGSNGGANLDPGEPVHAGIRGGSSIWATWTAPASGIATFTTRGSSFDTVLAVYTGDDIARLTEVASDDDGADFFTSFLRFNVQEGVAYQIAIDGVYGGQGEFLLNWSLNSSGPRLPEILRQPVDAVVTPGANASFTLQAINPPPATSPLKIQWYFNGLPIAGATDNTLTVPRVTESSLGAYFAIVSNEAESVFSDVVVIELNTTDEPIQNPAATQDKLAHLAPPINRQGVQRVSGSLGPLGSVVRGFTGSQVFSTLNSTTEAGEPNHCSVIGGASQWYSYVAQSNGFLTINTDGSDFDTILAVYTGSELDFASLNLIACDNDGGADGRDSRVAFQAMAGTRYLVVVDGVNGATGTAHINYVLHFPPQLKASRLGTQVTLRLTGAPGGLFTIESSNDLQTWTSLLSSNSPSGNVEWNGSRFSSRLFYRGFQAN